MFSVLYFSTFHPLSIHGAPWKRRNAEFPLIETARWETLMEVFRMRLMSCELPIRVEVRTVGWFINCLVARVLKNESTYCRLSGYSTMSFLEVVETYRRKLWSSGWNDWKWRRYGPSDIWQRKSRPVGIFGAYFRYFRRPHRPSDAPLEWGSLFWLIFKGEWLGNTSSLASLP